MIGTRPMEERDLGPCVATLNHIIAAGGTTAYEEPFTLDRLRAEYMQGAPVCNVALSADRVVGLQVCLDDGPGRFSVGTFTDRRNPVKGAGRALFARTLADCRALGGEAILAKITADNDGALAYYAAMGFEDWQVWPRDLTRKDGTCVDRIVKRFPL